MKIDETLSLKSAINSSDDFLNLDNLEQALRVNVSQKIKKVMMRFQKEKVSKKEFVNNICALDIVKASVENIRFVTFQIFKKKIESDSELQCPMSKKVLTDLCLLYGLNYLNNDYSSCFETGFFNNKKPFDRFIIEAIKTLLLRIRPQAIPIIESLQFPDESIMSAIGNSYGDIYETHLEWAKNSRMNQTKDAIPNGFMEYMMPILKGKM